MSRSYKKTPMAGDSKNTFMKKYSNRRIRRKLKNPDYILNNRDYKKATEYYDICDYWWYSPWNDYWARTVDAWLRWGYKYEPYPNEKEEYQRWRKWYKRK